MDRFFAISLLLIGSLVSIQSQAFDAQKWANKVRLHSVVKDLNGKILKEVLNGSAIPLTIEEKAGIENEVNSLKIDISSKIKLQLKGDQVVAGPYSVKYSPTGEMEFRKNGRKVNSANQPIDILLKKLLRQKDRSLFSQVLLPQAHAGFRPSMNAVSALVAFAGIQRLQKAHIECHPLDHYKLKGKDKSGKPKFTFKLKEKCTEERLRQIIAHLSRNDQKQFSDGKGAVIQNIYLDRPNSRKKTNGRN